LGRPLNETFVKSPFLPDRCTSPLKTFTVEEQSELIRKGKIGLSQRVADIGSAQKPPPGYRARTYSFIYQKQIFFKKIKRLWTVQGSGFKGSGL
jgi:hypothetical protein